MEKYDVIIVGAGPAGGQCARELASKNWKVLLIDKAKDFNENNYSSGGAPLDIMQEFGLPSTLVGSYWNTINIYSTKEKACWYSPNPFGPIIDFDKLRAFLAEETISKGSEVQLGYQYCSHQFSSDLIQVKIRNQHSNEEYNYQTRTLIDATGTDRKVLMSHTYNKNKAMAATGIEYHIQVNPSIYQKFENSLNFFLGHHWMPQGYAWIFPMASYRLKIGIIRYFQNHNYVSYNPSYRYYLDQLLHLCEVKSDNQILDKHGKTIHYTLRQKDLRYKGPVLAIGDAISTINPLGCEGIRHALFSGRYAAIEVDKFLRGKVVTFKGYDQAMKHYFGYKWFLSEILMSSLFKTNRDLLIDKTVHSFGLMDNDEIMEVIFRYRFRYALKSYCYYFASKIKEMLLFR